MTDLCPAPVDVSHWKAPQPGTIAEASLLLLKENRLCDVVFSFENSESQIEAHQLFLRARSPVFDSILRGRGSLGERRMVKVNDTTPQRFQQFLEFIYGDKFEADFSGALDLLRLAHKYKVEPLTTKCKEKLMTGLQFEDALEVFQTANSLGNLDDLKQSAGNVLAKSLYILYDNKVILDKVQKETWIYLLSQENLPLSEVDLFKLALRWGRSRCQEKPDNEALKSILAEILPLLRYTTMTAKEMATVVGPTQLLSPEETVDVYSYLCGDPTVRLEVLGRRQFKTVPRHRPDGVVVLFHDEGSTAAQNDPSSTAPLLETLGFCVSAKKMIEQATNPKNESKKLAITAIILQWPNRSVSPVPPASDSSALDFYLRLIRLKEKKVCKGAADCSFDITMKNCCPGKVVEIPVVPPVEIFKMRGFYLFLGDNLLDNYSGGNTDTTYNYACLSELQKLKDSAFVEFEDFVVELKDIQRNSDIFRLPDDFNSSRIRTIRGIRIASV